MQGVDRVPIDGQDVSVIPAAGPLLGIDWGERRIGLALSNEEQTIAHPLATLSRRTGRRFPLRQLQPLIARHRPVGIVFGLPLDAAGQEPPSVAVLRREATVVAEKSGLPLIFWDERMTTARARRAARDLQTSPRHGTDVVDQLAATVLLQGFLDSRR